MERQAYDNSVEGDGLYRRAALAVLLGGTLLVGNVKSAKAEVVSSVDTAPLQFVLNIHYLTTNYLQVIIYGNNSVLSPDLIKGGEIADKPGVAATGAKVVDFSKVDRTIRPRVREIADEHWYQLNLIRAFLRGDAPAQKALDYSPATVSPLFRAAGVIGQNDVFDPYASPTNSLLLLDTLLSVAATVYAGILPSLTNEIALPAMSSMASATASNLTTVRSILIDLARTDPTILTKIDQLAAWRDRVDGSSTTDQGLSSTTDASGQTVSRLTFTDSNGLFLTRTPQQALNVVFMTSASVTQGGFFSTGINGSIVQSAAN